MKIGGFAAISLKFHSSAHLHKYCRFLCIVFSFAGCYVWQIGLSTILLIAVF